MKSERRHELHTNALAEQLNEVLDYFRTRGQFIVYAVVAVVLVVAVVWFWRSTAEARRVEGWQTMKTLLSTGLQDDPQALDRMEQVAAGYSDPQLRAMAYAQLGKRLMQEAVVADEPATQQGYRQRAESAFEAALQAGSGSSTAAAIAQLGLGGIAAGRGDYDAAQKYYEAVGNNPAYEGTPFVSLAAEQITVLEQARNLPPLAATTQPATAGAATTQPATVGAATTQPVNG